MSYVFDPDRLSQLGAQHGPAYRTASPYPHAVIDDFLRPERALELARRFPGADADIGWDHFGAPRCIQSTKRPIG